MGVMLVGWWWAAMFGPNPCVALYNYTSMLMSVAGRRASASGAANIRSKSALQQTTTDPAPM